MTAPAGPGSPAEFIIHAVRPHHTRAVAAGSEKIPNLLISLRFRIVSSKGAPPNIYAYARIGPHGFRGVRMGPKNTTAFAWFGRGHSLNLGRIPVGFGPIASGKNPAFHMQLLCFGDWFAARAWPEGTPAPRDWPLLGRVAGQPSGKAGVGVWLSPRTPSEATVRFEQVSLRPIRNAADLLAQGLDLRPHPGLRPEQVPGKSGVFPLGDRVAIAAPPCALALDRRSGEITNFIDRATGVEFVAREEKRPLFRLILTRPYLGKRLELSSRAFSRTEWEIGPRAAAVTFSDCARAPVAVRVSFAPGTGANGGIRARFAVRNSSAWAVQALAGPLFAAPAHPPSSGKTNSAFWNLLLPWQGGVLVGDAGKNSFQRSALYPGSACVQFFALYDSRAGLYAALEDAGGHCKRFQVRVRKDISVEFDFQALFPEQPGRDQALPYATVLSTFHGDWRDAADRYRKWTVPRFCHQTVDQRRDIPGFLKDAPGILIAGIQNPNGRRRLFGRDLGKLPDLLDAYRRYTGLKHIVFVPYGWENRGTWAGIRYFPSVPSDAVWRKINAELRRRGHRTAFLTSGFWWVVKRRKTGNGPAFDDSALLKKYGKYCIHNPDGSLWRVDAYDKPRGPGSWRGYSVKLCHGSAGARALMKQIFLHVSSLGVPLISFDQEIGGGQIAPCYSREHGHPPGWGAWMWTDFRDLCGAIRRDARARPGGSPKELGLFLENESELAIPWMATYWSRQFGEVNMGAPGARGVGLFSYLYHDFIPCIGAACVQGQGAPGARPGALLRVHVLANNLTRGLIQGPFMNDVPLHPRDRWRRIVSRAWAAFCKPYARFSKYLLAGRTLRPPRISCGTIRTFYLRRDARRGKPFHKGGPPLVKIPLELPAVEAGCFQAPGGNVAAFLVNTDIRPQAARVRLDFPSGVTVYDAAGKRLRQAPPGAPGRWITMQFNPLETKVLVFSGKTNPASTGENAGK